MNKFISLIILGIIGINISSVAISAEESEHNYYEEEMVITASRISETQNEAPGKTEVITKTEIEVSGAATVAEVLTSEGFTVSSYGGASSVASLRLDGGSAEQCLILINGVPANDSTVGVVDLSYFPAAVVERIEIVHGPLSALYGANALGGVVNIITDLTGDVANNLSGKTGTYNSVNFDVVAKQKNWGIATGAATTAGHREHSQTNGTFFFGQYDFVETETQYLRLYLQAMTKDGEVPGSVDYPSTAIQFQRDLSLNLNGKNQWGKGVWEYKLFTQKIENQYHEFVDDFHETANYGSDLAGLYSLGQHELLFGLMLKNEFFNSSISLNHFQNSSALFIQDSWEIDDKLKFVSGIRWDQSSDYQSPISPRINLIYAQNQQLTMKFGYGKAFRAPTINELYWNQPDWGMYGNQDLEPEKGERYDLITEWQDTQQSISVNLYNSNYRDGIVWSPDADWLIFSPENIERISIYGMTFNWKYQWTKLLNTKLSYNYVDKKARNSATGNYTEQYNYFGKQQLNLSGGYHQTNYDLNFGWQIVQDRQQQTQSLPDYSLIWMNYQYRLNPNLQFNLKVNNLFDVIYEVQKNYPMPGREFCFNLDYKF